jgi:hypothetical protein
MIKPLSRRGGHLISSATDNGTRRRASEAVAAATAAGEGEQAARTLATAGFNLAPSQVMT